MNGDQAQRHIDEATDRVFEQGIENASQADLMFFGFGYLAKVIEKSRSSIFSGKKLLPLGVIIGAGVVEGLTWVIPLF